MSNSGSNNINTEKYSSWSNMVKGKTGKHEKQPEQEQPDFEKEYIHNYNLSSSSHQYYQDRDMQLWYIIKMNY